MNINPRRTPDLLSNIEIPLPEAYTAEDIKRYANSSISLKNNHCLYLLYKDDIEKAQAFIDTFDDKDENAND